MHFKELNATFGKLKDAKLMLAPGLNCIYAPNESGKTTWSRFILNMLYGINTRDRNVLADKSRYQPWNGGAMQGSMDLESGGNAYTIQRTTTRTNAPMGSFSCVYTGTAEEVPEFTSTNVGEILLGVPREVYERSAFIGQNALAVNQDAELERRIAALITTGEEDTSYSESYERLKNSSTVESITAPGKFPFWKVKFSLCSSRKTFWHPARRKQNAFSSRLIRSSFACKISKVNRPCGSKSMRKTAIANLCGSGRKPRQNYRNSATRPPQQKLC